MQPLEGITANIRHPESSARTAGAVVRRAPRRQCRVDRSSDDKSLFSRRFQPQPTAASLEKRPVLLAITLGSPLADSCPADAWSDAHVSEIAHFEFGRANE